MESEGAVLGLWRVVEVVEACIGPLSGYRCALTGISDDGQRLHKVLTSDFMMVLSLSSVLSPLSILTTLYSPIQPFYISSNTPPPNLLPPKFSTPLLSSLPMN